MSHYDRRAQNRETFWYPFQNGMTYYTCYLYNEYDLPYKSAVIAFSLLLTIHSDIVICRSKCS